MAIHFISGKPRGGKSLYAVKLVVDELLFGTRVVITNLPLKLGELNAYLQARYPEKTIDVLNRVIILTDDETRHFWTVRPGGVKIEVLNEHDWRAGRRPDYSAAKDGGVMYAIDEIHNFFNARAWAETGRDVLFYLSQHGKLGDTVLCITQHVGNVDKQFRSVTQDYTYLRNLTKEKMGLFTMPGIFIRKTYLQPATDTSAPMEQGTFRLDVSGLAACYDTAQGVGIHGRSADKSERKRGLPWWVAAVGAPIAIVLFLHYAPKGIAAATEPKRPPPRPAVTSASVTPGRPADLPPPRPAETVTPARVTPGPVSTNVPLHITGAMAMGARLIITLSDGRVVTEREGAVRTPDGAVTVVGETLKPFRGL